MLRIWQSNKKGDCVPGKKKNCTFIVFKLLSLVVKPNPNCHKSHGSKEVLEATEFNVAFSRREHGTRGEVSPGLSFWQLPHVSTK